jgi:ribose/xylose/arabinose/galactoside ABC-type transport system permease subunit
VGIPVLLILLALVFAVALVIERKTVLGRYIFAIGGNREAARLAGVAVLKVPFLLFVTSSLSAGVAGVIVTGQLGSASPQVGPSYMLAVVTAVILGGTSLTGGRGSVLGTLIAVLLLGVLQNGFALLELPSYVQTVALGVALILAVLIDQTTQRLER